MAPHQLYNDSSHEREQTARGRGFLRSRPTVDVTAVDISPNPAALTDELNLEVDFHLDVPVTNGVWDIEVCILYPATTKN
ncbi:hypothetical protein GQ600_22628 [Phytophthora cactorum]|nr:hypothetical protein GQ600_22628 [Phytophthora cactorum]